jgi:dihydroorotase/N-acyl-D-amino-acid deacylase
MSWIRQTRLYLALAVPSVGLAQSYDFVLRNARVFDGTGNPWYTADVAIRGDTIAAVGKIPASAAATAIDLSGLVLSPGFIDTHSHARHELFKVPTAENYIRQGVTAVIEGPDGSSPVPIAPFLTKVAASRVAINFGMMVGHGSVRSAVMGTENRNSTPKEIAKMRAIVRQAMQEGAFGLSTGLFYVPGNYAATEEVIELARVAAEFGGLHTSHMRDEAAKLLEAVSETIRIGEEGGLPTQLTHHKVIGGPNWGKSADTLRMVDEARARGVDVSIDQYPYTASNTGFTALFPQWAQAGGQKALVERLNAPDTRARIKQVIEDRIRTDRGAGDPKNVQFARCDFDKTLAGKSLADVVAARGLAVTIENAAEVAIDIQKRGGCSTIYHSMSERDLERILSHRSTMIASDGGIPVFGEDVPHPRSYGTFARVLGLYVRERRVISLEDAIRKMTSLPASRFRIGDRGILRPGMKADLAAFDPSRVADLATYEKPHQYAEGFVHVFVNGRPVLRHSKMTGNLPGRVLYGPGKR